MTPLPVISKVASIAWPAIPGGKGSQVLALLFQLEQSQWLSPEELALRQLEQLRRLVQHCGRQVPFYRERFRRAGFDPSFPGS